jgi:hypothetical protein
MIWPSPTRARNTFLEFPNVVNSQRRSNIPINSTTYVKDPDAKHLIIVVESFLLFAKLEICKLIDVPLFIDCEQDICRARRMQRDHCRQVWFDNLVWKNYLEFKPIQLENGKPIVFQGDQSEQDLLTLATKRINETIIALDDQVS